MYYHHILASGGNAPKWFANRQKNTDMIREWGFWVRVRALRFQAAAEYKKQDKQWREKKCDS